MFYMCAFMYSMCVQVPKEASRGWWIPQIVVAMSHWIWVLGITYLGLL